MRSGRVRIVGSVVAAIAAIVSGTLGSPRATAAPVAGPALAIDAALDRKPITPNIYGVSHAYVDASLYDEGLFSVDRFGGNATNRTNWTPTPDAPDGVSNTDGDYFFENYTFGTDPNGDQAGPNTQITFDRSRSPRVDTLLDLNTMGWITKTGSGGADGSRHACGFSTAPPPTGYKPQQDQDTTNECPASSGAHPGNGIKPCPTGSTFVAGAGLAEGECRDGNGNVVQQCTPGGVTTGCITGNNPTDTSFCPDGQSTDRDAACPAPAKWNGAWVAHNVTTYGPANATGVRRYDLDNEPGLWHETHRDVHPSMLTYDELTTKDIGVATAVKAADPTAEVVGPSDWAYPAYFDVPPYPSNPAGPGMQPSADRSAHNNLDLSAWFLQQMNAASQHAGHRLLDYFDQHYYEAAGASGEPSVALHPAGTTAQQRLRLRSTRSLWDPNYVDGECPNNDPTQSASYVTQAYGCDFGKINLINRMKGWVAQYYPGTKVSIGEYNWGALQDINGALAQADVLGIFGREGLDQALLWPADDNASGNVRFHAQDPGAFAFRMYRNYDGNHSSFGDTSVRATSADQDNLSVYGAQRSKDGALTIMVVNKSLTSDLQSPLSIANFAGTGSAQVFRYSDANLGTIQHLPDQPITNSGFTTTYPHNSITLFVIPRGGVTVTSSNNPSSAGQPVTFTATVASDPSGPAPTGAVQFKDNASPLGPPQPVDQNGRAQFSTSALADGIHAISADYSGDAHYPAASSPPLAQRVDPGIDGGGLHNCAVVSAGAIRCWGSNTKGQSTPVPGTYTAVSAGGYHSCGVKTDSTVACWGDNTYGQINPPPGTFLSVAAGMYHTCGVKTDHTVACWGYNGQGEAPSTVPGTFSSLAAGAYHTCGVRTDHTVACWGYNAYGQSTPPSGTFNSVSAGHYHSCGIRTSGTLACWGYNGQGQTNAPAGTFGALSAGGLHTCAISTASVLTCWGSNAQGQTSVPAGSYDVVSAGWYHTCAVNASAVVRCWGYNTDGESNVPSGV